MGGQDVDPLIHAAMRVDSLPDLPTALIEARIAANLTQRVLAGRLDVAEQQVQRWEATAYTGVGLERLQDIADALDVYESPAHAGLSSF